MKRLLQIVFFNVGLFVLLVSLVNILSVSATFLYERLLEERDLWKEFPNYVGEDRTSALEEDFLSSVTEYRPFVGWRRLPYSGKTTTIDQQGRRRHDPNPKNLENARVVAFFGGSTMWGSGVADSGTIPALFDQIADQYVALNLGETGYNSRQNLETMINMLNAEETIDVAVFYDGVNDVFGCRSTASLNTHAQEPALRQKLSKKSGGSIFLTLIEPTTTFLGKVTNVLYDTQDYLCDRFPENAEAVADVMIKNWHHAHTIAANNGVKFFAVLQPVSYIGSPRLDHLRLDRRLGDQYGAVYPILKKKITMLSNDWIFDFTDSFDGHDYTYIDFCHVSEEGNRLIADRMLEMLLK